MKSDVQQITETKKRIRKSDDPIQLPPEPIQYFTAGEIFRGKMLLTIHGTPHKARMKVNRVVAQLATVEVETPWGLSKAISTDQINHHNEIIMRYISVKMKLREFVEGRDDDDIYKFSVQKLLRVNHEAPQPQGHTELSTPEPLTETPPSVPDVL